MDSEYLSFCDLAALYFELYEYYTQQTLNICITFVQRRPNVFDVGPTWYKCYRHIRCLLGRPILSNFKRVIKLPMFFCTFNLSNLQSLTVLIDRPAPCWPWVNSSGQPHELTNTGSIMCLKLLISSGHNLTCSITKPGERKHCTNAHPMPCPFSQGGCLHHIYVDHRIQSQVKVSR